MKITVVLAVWLASSSCVRAGICDAWPNAIEADMRVTESHLTAAAVRKAENFLREHEVEVSAFCDWLVTKGFWYD